MKIRRSESGYEMASRILSLRTWHNGSGYNDHDLAQRVGLELTHRIDPAGRLVAIDGMREIFRVARLQWRGIPIPPSIMIGERDLFAGYAYQWNRQVGLLAGSTIEIGGTAETTASLPLPGGRSVSIPGKITVARVASCPAQRCVLAWFEARSSDSALAKWLAEVVGSDPALRRQGKKAKPIASGVAIEADLVIDPDTMLIYRDTGKQIMSYEIDQPGYGPASYRVTQEWHYTFDYPAAP